MTELPLGEGQARRCGHCRTEIVRKHCLACGTTEHAAMFAARKFCSATCYKAYRAAVAGRRKRKVTARTRRKKCATCSMRVPTERAIYCAMCRWERDIAKDRNRYRQAA
jgi:hypothetical protein